MYEDRVLAFIDLLGFSDKINKTMKNGKEVKSKTENIDNLFENIQEYIIKLFPDDKSNGSLVMTHFSDTIIISCLKSERLEVLNVLIKTLFLCVTALQSEFLCRGVIVSDKLRHTNEKVFGPAMIKAYDMEQKLAIYPRIILDNDVVDIIKKYSSESYNKKDKLSFIRESISTDFDGLHYLNCFDGINYVAGDKDGILVYFDALRKIIIDLKKKIDNTSIKSKYLWLKEKYNATFIKYKKKYSKSETKEPELNEYLKNINEI